MNFYKKTLIILSFVFVGSSVFAQKNKSYSVSILTDKSTNRVNKLLQQLKNEIKAVVGQDKPIEFLDVLENNFSTETAKSNYQKASENSDIILAFGLINNITIHKENNYPKPTIVFGAVNNDFINLPKDQNTSGIHNLTYLITPQSYTDDLSVFKSMYDYKKVGVLVDDEVYKNLPVKDVLDNYFSSKDAYQLINLSNLNNVDKELDGIDAVYLAGGFHLSKNDFSTLVNTINTKKIPSFSAFGIQHVENGILATNQPDNNIDQFFRRIALSVESVISGDNPSTLPMHIDYKNRLTINYQTAKLIDFPIKYTLLGKADIISQTEEALPQNALSIIDMMQGVVQKNLSLQSEKKEVELAGQDIKTAKSNYLPNVTANVNTVHIDPELAKASNGINPEFSTDGNITAQQLIYSQSATTGVKIQEDLLKAQKTTYSSAELDALLNASVAYFNALVLKTNTKIQNQNLQVTKRNLEIAEQNFEAGLSGKSDMLRFRSQLAQNTQSLVEAGNGLKQAFNTINQLLNNPISKEIDVEDAEISKGIFKNYNYDGFLKLLDDPRIQNHLITFLTEEAKKNAPELKGIGFSKDVLDKNYHLNTTGRFIPTVSLQAQYNKNISRSGIGSSINAFPNNDYNVALNISLPIFQQNQRNINKQTIKIQEDQLSIQQENLELNLEKNVNDMVLDLVNQIANIEISKVSEEAAKESLELTQNAYKNGAVPVIQLIDAQTNYLQTQLASATANYSYLITSMQLERAIGYFFLMHTEEENQAFTQRVYQYVLNKN